MSKRKPIQLRSHTFTRTVTLQDSQYQMLKKIAAREVCWNFRDDETLDLCDSLRDKGLINEDSDGRVCINTKGLEFLQAHP